MRRALFLILAVAFASAIASPALAECGSIYKSSATCQPDGRIKIAWAASQNGTCTDFRYSIERKCGNGQYVLIADPAANPYYDGPQFPIQCQNWYYRITMHCVCDGVEQTTSVEVGPVSCP